MKGNVSKATKWTDPRFGVVSWGIMTAIGAHRGWLEMTIIFAFLCGVSVQRWLAVE